MRRLFAILISAFLVVGFAPLANAAAGPALNADRADTTFTESGLSLCSDNARFQQRASTKSIGIFVLFRQVHMALILQALSWLA